MQKLSYSNSLNSDDKRLLEEWKKIDSGSSEDQLSKILFHTSVENSFDEKAKEAAYNRFLTQIENNESPVKKTRIFSLNLLAKVAAAALILVFSWFGFEAVKGEEFNYVTTTEKQTFVLPDGSEITLNSQSKLVYTKRMFGDREVKMLKGKGMFDVARDESKPFKVYFRDGIVEVLGTEFVVDLEDKEESSVTVREGKVAFMAHKSKAVLTAKEKGVYDNVNKRLVVKKRRTLKDFDWLSDDESKDSYFTYSKFIDQLEDELNIVIQDDRVSDKLKSCRLFFNYNDNPEGIIHVLEKDFDLKVQLVIKKNLWILSGGDASKCR